MDERKHFLLTVLRVFITSFSHNLQLFSVDVHDYYESDSDYESFDDSDYYEEESSDEE